MKVFDSNAYRKQVLARLLDDFSLADPDTGDLFLVCDVELTADTTPALARLLDVVTAWQKESNNPKYRGVAAQLVANRPRYEKILADPVEREKARVRVLGARQKTDTAAVAELDTFAQELARRHGGIPRSKVSILAEFAAQEGLADESFAAWLTRYSAIEDGSADGASAWQPAVRRQVRKALEELALANPGQAKRCRTLLTFLGVGPAATETQIWAAHARLSEANRLRGRDRVMALTADLLTEASTRLPAAGGMAGYAASLQADARDTLKTELRRRRLFTGSLPAADFEALVARILSLSWGFDAHEARDIVLDAAHDAQLAVEVSVDVDLIVCGVCGRPQSAGQGGRCAYCQADLYQNCPLCHQVIPAACDVCPECSTSLAVWRSAHLTVPAAAEHLMAGRAQSAQQLCQDALGGTDPATAPRALRELLANARETVDRAGQRWAELKTDRTQGRLWGAAVTATWLARNAVDVPDPHGGPPAADVLAALEEQKRGVSNAVRDAATLPDEQVESALIQLYREHPDSPDAKAALAARPLPAPTQVTAAISGGAVQVSWAPVTSASRTVRYQVDRHISWPSARAGTTTVATTTATHLEDAGAPGCVTVAYTVTAVDGVRASQSVSCAEELFIDRDVEVVRAQTKGPRVTLSWPCDSLGDAEVVIERQVLRSGSDPAPPIRRILPVEPGRYVDDDVDCDVSYSYRVRLTYRRPDGQVVSTAGQLATVSVHELPSPVNDLRASTGDDCRTTLLFSAAPAGRVQVYARPGDGPPLGAFATGSLGELSAAARDARLVGEGTRSLVDTAARGPVAYQAVTVSGDATAAGPFLQHLAVPKPTTLKVVEENGRGVRVRFEWPGTVTEAFVCWRRDRYPLSAEEPADPSAGAGRKLVTNTKLEIDDGFTIDAPDDGRGLYVVVFPVMRHGTTVITSREGRGLLARATEQLEVSYTVHLSGTLRRRVEVKVSSGTRRPLPMLFLVGAARDPGHLYTGERLAEYRGRGHETTLDVDNVPAGVQVVRLFGKSRHGLQVIVHHPEVADRTVGR